MNKYIIFLMLLLCTIANAQNSIQGKITNQDNEPMIGATVFVVQQNKSIKSNSNGDYQLKNLPKGRIDIQFSYIGYYNKVETVFLDGKISELNVILRQTPIEAEGIVVSAGYTSTEHDNAVKIDVLDITQPTNVITNNFMEVLTKIPGINMISKGSGVSKPVIRGLSMNDILVLSNNVRFENYQFSDHHPLGIDEFGIDDVEIIKGPASLLYGSDAIGGVINFTKEKPAPVGKIVGDYNLQLFSNSLGMTNNFGIKGATNNLYGGIRFGNKTNADYLQGEGEFVPNTRFNGNSLKSNIGFNNQNMALSLFYDYSNYNVGISEEGSIDFVKPQGRGRSHEVFYMLLDNHLISTQNKFFINNYLLEVRGSYQSSGLIHAEGPNEYSIDMTLQTITYETRLYLPAFDNSEYIIGFSGLSQINTNNNNREVILLPNAKINNYSAFGMLQQTIFEHINLQAGLRYDFKQINSESVDNISAPTFRPSLEFNNGNISGSIGAVFNISNSLLARFNFASAFRTPTLSELTSNGLHESRYELGDSKLANEKGYETDLSIHYHIDNFTFDIAGFNNILNDFIYLSPSTDTSSNGDKIYKYKQSNSNLYGIETGLHYHPTYIDWLHFETSFSSVIGKKENGEYLPFIPANKIQCELRFEKDSLWNFQNVFFKFSFQTVFEQDKPSFDEDKTDGYTLVDFGLGASFKIANQQVIIGIGANNVLDTKYIDHLSTLKEVGYFNPGRNIALSLKIPFELK